MSQNTMKLQQESFFVIKEIEEARKKIIRQDRWQTEPLQCFISLNGTMYEVSNISTFGCACLVTESQAKEIQSWENSNGYFFKVIYENIETQTVNLKPVRFSHLGPNLISVGFETTNEPINVERCKAINSANQIIQKQESQLSKSQKIPVMFRTTVFDLKHWFMSLREQVDELENKSPIDSAKATEDYKFTIAEVVSDYLGRFLPSVYKNIPDILNNLGTEEKSLCTAFIREQLGPFVYGAPFANRAFYKPRGYAGDYEMMNHLYRNELVGKTLFDQCMHKYFIEEPAGNAVKNRGEYLHQKIKNLVQATPASKPLKILSIASGPAMELQLFLKNNTELYGRSIEFTCIDQDEESLKHAQKQLYSLERQRNSGFKFKFSNLAIKNIIVQGLPETNYDLIYSAGLFDYFTDPVAQLAAKQMVAGLADGGQAIIGNFSKDNPCVPFMEYVLDWILIYRSEENMKQMFSNLGSSISVEKESLGVNLFAVIKK